MEWHPRRKFAAVDVEIASRFPLAVCAVAAVVYSDGCETSAYSSLVRFSGRVRYTDIHGLIGADLRVAPTWPVVWRQLCRLLETVNVVVAFRATFDRAALMTMCARHGTFMPRVRFLCAAEMYRDQLGQSVSLEHALNRLEVPYPGRPHEPLADARAAAALALKLHSLREEGEPIQLSKTSRPDARATNRRLR